MESSLKTNINRLSNFELLRIIMMIMIVFHHYCVNSGLQNLLVENEPMMNSFFILLFSIGGKIGVNGFLILSGYFLINSYFNRKKIYKLIFEIVFYNIFVTVFLYILGYSFTLKDYVKILIPIIFDFPESFIGTYILIYLLSPFINNGIKNISNKQFKFILVILIMYFSILQTFLFRNTWNYLGWGITMYMVGAYLRINDVNISIKKSFILFIINIVIIWLSSILNLYFHFLDDYFFMITNANKFFIFSASILLFLLFKNISIKQNHIINKFAGSTFGVLLLHSNCEQMRKWLWNDFLDVTSFFNSSLFILHMFITVFCIYIICSIIDFLRIKFIEKPLFLLLKI